MNNLTDNNSDVDIGSTPVDLFENQIIYCSERANLLSSLGQLKKIDPKLIIYDISHNFYPIEIQLNPVENSEEVYNLKSSPIFHDKTSLKFFLNEMSKFFHIFHSILGNDGFLAIKVNGSIKAPVKQILDTVFHLENFMNEIIVNSPTKIHYSKENAFFERTDYFLLYSISAIRKINPVYDEKESGGYWHSFVSKGQGSPKKFLIDGELILLDPPSGTHWKLKQESILNLCKKGQIRLNRRGNPEYWVLPKIGQIVDTNWLDLDIAKVKNHQGSYYSRLFKVLLAPNQLVLIITPRTSSSLIEAFNSGFRWVCLVEGKKILKTLKVSLTQEKINFMIKTPQNLTESNREFPEIPSVLNKKEKPSSAVEHCSLSPISLYSEQLEFPPKLDRDCVNLLIWGDCFQVLRLLQVKYHQTIKVIYIDPPFYTGYNESMHIPFQHTNNSDPNEKYISDFSIKTVAYKNVLQTNTPIEDFKRWFRERVTLMRPLLRLDGFIFVRFDYHFGHYAKEILDEVFGEENFVLEFIIRRMKKNLSEKQLNKQTHLIVHSDSLFVFRNSKQAILRPELIRKRTRKGQIKAEIEYSDDNLWIDIAGYQKVKRTIYPTENSEALLKRVIEVSTSEGDLVADFFAGSGTTLSMAEKLGRKWVGTDIGMLSINEIRKRILQGKERSSFEFHELIDSRTNIETKIKSNFEFEVKIEKKQLLQGTEIVLTLINLLHTSPLSELKNNSFLDLIDYWEIDWYYKKPMAEIWWYSHRNIKRKKVEKIITVSTSHEYSQIGESVIWVNVIDILGSSSHKIIKIDLK